MYFLALAGAAVACYFLYAMWRGPRPAVIVAFILWVLYAIWELAAARGALVDGVYCHPTTMCNIGYDLFFWPILLIASAFALYAPGRWTSTGKTMAGIGIVVLGVLIAIGTGLYVEDRARESSKRVSNPSDAKPAGK